MTRRFRTLAAAVLGLCVAHPLTGRGADLPPAGALPPVPAATKAAEPTNRDVAVAVSDALRQAGKAGQLRHYNIDVAVKDGTAELSGTVASPQQREEALRLVKGVAGVSHVVDKMTLLAPNPITQVQATAPTVPAVQPPPGGAAPPPAVAPPPMREPLAAPPAGVIPEPVPVFAAPMPSPYDLNPPLMPPYAWPTYAPYNNFSRVGYPSLYPYQSWPFIGPMHPFPKIPLGWRSVTLQWMDGCWFYGRTATGHDWWRIRYW